MLKCIAAVCVTYEEMMWFVFYEKGIKKEKNVPGIPMSIQAQIKSKWGIYGNTDSIMLFASKPQLASIVYGTPLALN